MSHSAAVSSSSAEAQFYYAQLESKDEKVGALQIPSKKYNDFSNLLNLPLAADLESRRNDRRRFMENIFGILLNNELQHSQQEEYTGEVVSLMMSQGKDGLPAFEIALLEVCNLNDPASNNNPRELSYRTYRFNLDKQWNITTVGVTNQVLISFPSQELNEAEAIQINMTPCNATILVESAYLKQEAAEFDAASVEELLEDLIIAKEEQSIHAAINYYQLDDHYTKLSDGLRLMKNDFKSIRKKIGDPALQGKVPVLKEAVEKLHESYKSQEKKYAEFETKLGKAHAEFQAELHDNTDIASSLITDVTKGLDSEVRRLIANSNKESDIESEDETKDSSSEATIQYLLANAAAGVKQADQETENPIDTLRSYVTSATGMIEEYIANSNQKFADVKHASSAVQGVRTQDAKTANQANLSKLQDQLKWIPHLKIDTKKTNQEEFEVESKRIIAEVAKFYQSHLKMYKNLQRAFSQASRNKLEKILAACNDAMSDQTISEDFKNWMKNKLQIDYITFSEKEKKFIFQKEKRKQDLETAYASKKPSIDGLLAEVENTRQQISILSAQIDSSVKDAEHDQQLESAAVLNRAPKGSFLETASQDYYTSHFAVRTSAQEISTLLFGIKESVELAQRLEPVVRELEQHLLSNLASDLNVNSQKIITELKTYYELEEKSGGHKQQVKDFHRELGALVEGLKSKLTNLKDTNQLPNLPYEYAFAQLNSLKPNDIKQVVNVINNIIEKDKVWHSNSTISYLVRQWLPELLQGTALGKILTIVDKQLVHQPSPEEIRVQQLNLQEEKLIEDLTLHAANYKERSGDWKGAKEKIGKKITDMKQLLAGINKMRGIANAMIEDISQEQTGLFANFNHDLVLYQELCNTSEVIATISAHKNNIKTTLSGMQEIQAQLRKPDVTLEQASEMIIRMTALQDTAGQQFQAVKEKQQKLFPKSIVRGRDEQYTGLQNLFSLIKKIVIEGLPYWNNKGDTPFSHNGNQYHVQPYIGTLATNILAFELHNTQSNMPLTEMDIKKMLRVTFSERDMPEDIKEITEVLRKISNTDLKNVYKLTKRCGELSERLEIVSDLPAQPNEPAREASLGKLYRLMEEISGAEEFWKEQKRFGKTKIPNRVKQMREAIVKMDSSLPPNTKIKVALGITSPHTGFFLTDSTLDPSRSEETTTFYSIMKKIHLSNLTEETNVQSFIADLRRFRRKMKIPTHSSVASPAAGSALAAASAAAAAPAASASGNGEQVDQNHGLTSDNISTVLSSVADIIRIKRKSNESFLTRRDKTLETRRIDAWDAFHRSCSRDDPSIMQSNLADIISKNIDITRTRFQEKESKTLPDDQLDLGKIYEKTAEKLASISVQAFVNVITMAAEKTKISDLRLFLKGLSKDCVRSVEKELTAASLSRARRQELH